MQAGEVVDDRRREDDMHAYAIAPTVESPPEEFLMILDDRETAEDIAHELRGRGQPAVVIKVERAD
jgi:hypothetical protein